MNYAINDMGKRNQVHLVMVDGQFVINIMLAILLPFGDVRLLYF